MSNGAADWDSLAKDGLQCVPEARQRADAGGSDKYGTKHENKTINCRQAHRYSYHRIGAPALRSLYGKGEIFVAKGQNTPITDIIQLDASIPAKMAKQTTYNIDGRNFIVTPVFHEDGRESFGSILMRLMKAEVSSQL